MNLDTTIYVLTVVVLITSGTALSLYLKLRKERKEALLKSNLLVASNQKYKKAIRNSIHLASTCVRCSRMLKAQMAKKEASKSPTGNKT